MTGTVMERSHAKLTQWAVAFHMAASSKKGFSAHQLHRELGCQYNTAWFLHHRVMEAMRRGGLDLPPMGGEGQIVEADETYFGNIPEASAQVHNGPAVFQAGSLARRTSAPCGAGRTWRRSALIQYPGRRLANVVKIVRDNIARESRLHTDESRLYIGIGKEFAAHETVNTFARNTRAAT